MFHESRQVQARRRATHHRSIRYPTALRAVDSEEVAAHPAGTWTYAYESR